MLLVIENMIPEKLIQYFQDNWEQASWIPGKITAGFQAAKVKQNQQLSDEDQLAQLMRQSILETLTCNTEFLSAAIPNKIYPPKFNCYQDGGHYGTHVDNAILSLANGETMRTDLSATIFLSPPESYQGGELVIESEFAAQEIKLKAGDMVLYPASSLHQVMPVTSGVRLAAFFWVQSLIASTQDRSLLFDLDQSIQNLSLIEKNQMVDAEINQLTGIYHNLVRRWSQV
ncbi:Fe2+-dependent dioxygenase [Aliikangiella maris]|uniref:Fe2+-dependent dioxygenase n=2 Tax=Aliikangiella maris TaxID=3162458 RepID=A0ABV2BUD1_9GAMM